MSASAAAAPFEGGGVYLRAYLAPLTGMLARPDVTDIYVNRPGELWVETIAGEIERHDAPRLDEATLERLARQIAAIAHQGISREHPLLSATLPDEHPDTSPGTAMRHAAARTRVGRFRHARDAVPIREIGRSSRACPSS